MYFTNGSSRAFEMLMRGRPGFERHENGGCAGCKDCNTCRFTVRIGRTSSVCPRNVRMSRAS